MRFRSLVAAFAAVMPLTLVAATPATAAPGADTFVLTGSGTFTPGLDPVVVQNHAVNVNGTATSVGTNGVLSTWSCSLNGNFQGNLSNGSGNLSGSCGFIPLTCAYVYVLNQWYGVCVSVILVINCSVAYSNFNPPTNYAIACLGKKVTIS